MRHPIRAALLGGFAAVSVAGLAGVAQAREPGRHIVTLALPGGGEAEVAYTGNTPPHLVSYTPAPLPADPFALLRTAFGPHSPFAAIDAEMQRETAMMLRQAELMAAAPGWMMMPGNSLTLAALPAGSGVCVQSMSITYTGNGSAPRVVRRQAGDCGLSPAPAPTATPSYRPVQPAHPAGTILVRSTVPAQQPQLQEATYWRPVIPPASR